MQYHLGVDIGTTAVKVAAFSVNGETLGQRTRSYEMLHPAPGRSEQNADEVTRAVVESINQAYEELLPAHPATISFSAAMHSVMAVDRQGDPLSNCIIWADNRAADFAEAFRNTQQGKEFYNASGVPVHAMSPFCKLRWFREHNPSLYKSAYKFIGIKEYVFFRLFGEFAVDTSIASATGLLQLNSLEWDAGILDFLQLDQAKLSTVVSVKKKFTLRRRKDYPITEQLRLPDGIPVIIGGSDGACANLGIGEAHRRAMVITIGTSSAARMLTAAPAVDAAMRTFCYHAIDEWYIQGGASNNGAIVMEWLKDNLLEAGEDMAAFLELGHRSPIGADGLVFLPYLLGERAPIWNAQAKGVFFGLSVNHTRAHLVRSALEGVIYCVYGIGKALMEKNEVNEIYATGGFARSAFWLQMTADVFNKRVILSGSSESSAWGAAIIGMETVGIKPGELRQQPVAYEPDVERHVRYAAQYKRFERLNALLGAEFGRGEVG